MSDLAMWGFIIVPSVVSGLLCYALGYGEGNNICAALSEELRRTKAELARLTDRDEKGRYVRREL